jgi:Zn-dependent peptidase ImmA (M78 family)
MKTGVNVNANILTWAITRAGYGVNEFISTLPNVQGWIDGTKKPTVKQLEGFSKKVHLPFGYFFLTEPPKENLPIPFFRTGNTEATKVSVNVYDTILLMQQRQDWLRDYLKDNEFEELPFVSKFLNQNNVQNIVSDIRKTLGLNENWASSFMTWTEALDHLVQHIEDKGIITVFNGVVENSTRRKIPVDECRGFVLVDKTAPFMFINNADSKAAQMFTIAHELAHIWTGHSAGFDFRKLQPSDNPIEVLCDQVAAEFLVPKTIFNTIWSEKQDITQSIKYASKYFKVSEIVIARRALDIGKISKTQFFNFYDEYINREIFKKENQGDGGNFYATTKKRLSITFATHINNAVNSGQLLYRDAYKLTSLKGDTFKTFFSKHI